MEGRTLMRAQKKRTRSFHLSDGVYERINALCERYGHIVPKNTVVSALVRAFERLGPEQQRELIRHEVLPDDAGRDSDEGPA